MTGFGSYPTTGTQTALPTNQLPVSSVATPNTPNADLTATEGGPRTQDNNGNWTAPTSIYIKDGGNVAQGTTTDAAWSGSGAGTEIALLKKLVALLAGTLVMSGNVTEANSTAILADLATLAGAVSSSKMATKAASGDFADGAITTLGNLADGAWSGSGSGSVVAILKKVEALLAATLAISGNVTEANSASILAALDNGQETMANSLSVTVASDQSAVPVSGTFWQATQPISAGSLPLPTGAAKESGGNLDAINTATTGLAGIVSSNKAAVKAASGDLADGALATLGAKADAKNSATDTTAITAMQVLKQISYMSQNPGIYNSTPPALTNGQTAQFQFDSSGRVLMNMAALSYITDSIQAYELFYQPPTTTVTWTSSTAQNTRFSASTVGYGIVRLTAIVTGSPTGGQLTFEGNDGTNYFTIPGKESGVFVLDQTYNLSNGSKSWEFNAAGWQTFDVNLSTVLSGGSSPQVVLIMQTLPGIRDITTVAGINDGTQTANTFAGDANENGLIIGSGVKTFTYSITSNTATTAIDLANYPSFSISLTAIGSGGTLNVQSCDTGVSADFLAQTVYSGTSLSADHGVSSFGAAVNRFWGNRTGRYLRLNPTGISSGTYAVTITCYSVGNMVPLIGSGTNAVVPSIAYLQGIYDGTNMQAVRGNLDNITLLNVTTVTGTQTGTDQTNFNGKGVKIFTNVSAIGSGTLVVSIQVKDPVSPGYVTLLSSASIISNGLTTLTVYPGLLAVANSIANDIITKTWRVLVTGANNSSFTVSAAVMGN